MQTMVGACRTAWGWVGAAASSVGLLGITLPRESKEEALASLQESWPQAQEGRGFCLAALHNELQRYFDGQAVDLSGVVLDVHGATDFQIRVWAEVRAIPRGQVRSYAWVARRAGSSRAARAVGRAMAANPFPIVVPCHRVVGKDCQLTGFAAGLDMKRRLLEMEGAPVGRLCLDG